MAMKMQVCNGDGPKRARCGVDTLAAIWPGWNLKGRGYRAQSAPKSEIFFLAQPVWSLQLDWSWSQGLLRVLHGRTRARQAPKKYGYISHPEVMQPAGYLGSVDNRRDATWNSSVLQHRCRSCLEL